MPQPSEEVLDQTPTLDEELADALFSVAHALKRQANAHLQGTDLSIARIKVVFALQRGGPVRIGELSREMGVAARTMTSTVAAMERDGLVRRRPDPADGRATVVELTVRGRWVFRQTRKVRRAILAEAFATLEPPERVALLGTLRRLAPDGGPAGFPEAGSGQ